MKRLVGLGAISVGLAMALGPLATLAWGYLGLLQSLGQVIQDAKFIARKSPKEKA